MLTVAAILLSTLAGSAHLQEGHGHEGSGQEGHEHERAGHDQEGHGDHDGADHDRAAGGLTLHEPTSGVTLTLPEDWQFSKGDGGIMAVSEDKGGYILMIAAERDFETVREDVRALILTRLDDVVVATTTVEGVNERGALEEIVTATGQGKSRLDGKTVDFAGLLVRSGDSGGLVLGAWKDEANQTRIARILESLHVKKSVGETGLAISDKATGARVVIPAGWEILRNRKGLFATCPHGKAMAVLMGWQANFDASFKGVRAALMSWVLKDVQIGEFAVVEATYHESLGRVVAANGTAVDRGDESPVSFTALRIQRVDQDRGAVLFGAWKDDVHAEEVSALLSSIRMAKPDVAK